MSMYRVVVKKGEKTIYVSFWSDIHTAVTELVKANQRCKDQELVCLECNCA